MSILRRKHLAQHLSRCVIQQQSRLILDGQALEHRIEERVFPGVG